MKVCPKCEARLDDKLILCPQCSARLIKVTPGQQAEIDQKIKEDVEYLSDVGRHFDWPLVYKIFGILSCIGGLVCLVMCFINREDTLNIPYELQWVGVFFFAMSALEALIPRVLWSVSIHMMSLDYDNVEELEPSSWAIIRMKIGIIALFFFGLIVLAAQFHII